jgi:hypothetical protein
MDVIIRRLDAANQADLNRCANAFIVDAELCLHAGDGRISYTVRPVTPYVKHYDPEVYGAQTYIAQIRQTGGEDSLI